MTRNRLKHVFSAAVLLIIICGSSLPGYAFNYETALWQRQQRGIRCILNNWQRGEPSKSYEQCFGDIITAEAGLLGYDVRPDDERLVSCLADDGSDNRIINLPRFAYLIFVHRLNANIGWKPQCDRVFTGRRYRVFSHEDPALFFHLNTK